MKRILFQAGLACVFAGCTQQYAGFEQESGDRLKAHTEALAEKSEVLRYGGTVDADRAFYGRTLNSGFDQFAVDHGKPFPKQFEREDSFEIVMPKPVSLDEIELLMQELTDLNVILRNSSSFGDEDSNSDTESGGKAGNSSLGKKIRINHKGGLSQLVRIIASRFDLAWTFDGETIIFNTVETRRYNLPIPSTNGEVTASLNGVDAGGNSVTSSRSFSFGPWEEINNALTSVVGSNGQVSISSNAGQVTIFAPPSIQEEAARIIKTFYDIYSRRIGLEIATFYVDTSKSAELAVDLGVTGSSGDLNTARLGRGTLDVLNGVTGSTLISNRYTVNFNLRNIADSAGVIDYQVSNTVAQHGVVTPVVLTNSRNYVSSRNTIQTAEGGSSTSIETDAISSGISIYTLPRLMNDGKIHLSIWINQADLNSLVSFDTGNGNIVQLPDTDQRALEYTLIMNPGETLVMGGYEQERSMSEGSGGVGRAGALGLQKNRKGDTKRTRMIFMVRPTLIGN